MDVKEAFKIATDHVSDLFSAEDISNVGLEEVEFDFQELECQITIGFSRPWDYPKGALAVMATGEAGRPKRSYKLLTIPDGGGGVLSIKNRESSKIA